MNIKNPIKQDFDGLHKLWKEAFGDTNEYINTFFETAFSPERCRCVTEDSEVIAALYWFNCIYSGRPIAYIYAVATSSSHRGRGVCNTLMADTHKLLAELGYEGAILVPGSKSLFDFYKKMGYKICSHISEFECESSDKKIKLTQIEKEEYALLRSKLLPYGGVIQEEENLEFLSTHATFYKGDNFLLASQKEKDRLFGIELLGDTGLAPDILKSLNCKKGKFRSPGKGREYAMYLPLGDTTLPSPSYFGLAFD